MLFDAANKKRNEMLIKIGPFFFDGLRTKEITLIAQSDFFPQNWIKWNRISKKKQYFHVRCFCWFQAIIFNQKT